ncbi:MAG TPA: FliH/SctL family protein, partial [Chloroflexota bacterium]|nr:FliH/SctL family protein [Chloroflexota bacterium]
MRVEEAGEVITTLAEARQILAEHQADAAALVAEAEAQRQAIFDDARTTGHAEGHAAGYAEGAQAARDELTTELELAHGVAAQAKIDRATLIAAAEPEIVRLSMEVTRKLIAREVETDSDIVKGLVTRAMLKAAGDGPIRLRLHPDTIARVGAYLSDVSARFVSRGVEVVPDPTVEPAGAIVDTRTGSVDARLSTQLAKVESTLLSLTGETA